MLLPTCMSVDLCCGHLLVYMYLSVRTWPTCTFVWFSLNLLALPQEDVFGDSRRLNVAIRLFGKVFAAAIASVLIRIRIEMNKGIRHTDGAAATLLLSPGHVVGLVDEEVK